MLLAHLGYKKNKCILTPTNTHACLLSLTN
jgi:hypothetical protein